VFARVRWLEHATSVSPAIPRLLSRDHDSLLVCDAGVFRCVRARDG
jgi:hypothetical protein